ncbi:MAG: LysR substrate-binding domain-containing protein [Proteobacteria bacterium]|nr:LysR substrate-binding domain-containing protein [Pseudomonadota bacterium]MDA1153614.1 LysR substrate-binding domain-containing protein [Pseudomonadota bacterium]
MKLTTTIKFRCGMMPAGFARQSAMLLQARAGLGLAIAPTVVVADELASGMLATAPFDLGITEPFLAVTLPRKLPHPALAGLLRGLGVIVATAERSA